jgi:hypothetical protein
LCAVVAAAGCKTSEKREPDEQAGPPAVASCDYKVEAQGGTSHRCLEIFDPAAIADQETWCKELSGPKNQPTFARRACPVDGRKGGCLYPNGTIEWLYSGESSCVGGLDFKTAPKIRGATPYRCATPKLCRETVSVINLAHTAEKQSCEAGGGTFEPGMCSAAGVVGRCTTKERTRTTTWVYYDPALSPEQVKQHCDGMRGTFAR